MSEAQQDALISVFKALQRHFVPEPVSREFTTPPAAMRLFSALIWVLQVSLLWMVVIGFNVRRVKSRRSSCIVSFGQENGLSFGREAGGRKRPSKGAAAAGKFEEKADFSKSRSKRDADVEANRNDLLERLGLEDYEDEFASGSDLRKGRKDAARLDRKKETKKAKLAEKKRLKELGVFREDDDMELSLQERATAVWEDLCLRSAFLLPEEMGNQLILQEDDEDDENQSDADGGGSLLRLWTQEHLLSGVGYLDILRSFYTGGRILPGEGEEGEKEGFFLFALAALFASLDGFPPLLEKRGALDLPGFLLHDAWQGGNRLDICRRYDILQSALSSWRIGRSSSCKGVDTEGVSSRHVGLEDEQCVSMHDALKAGMLTAALRALQSSIDSDENDNGDDDDLNDRITQCTALLQGLLKRQADVFLRVHRSVSHKENSVSGEGLIASTAVLVKLAKMMVCTSVCIDSAKPPKSLLNLANERAERYNGAYMTAKQLCSSCGIYTEKIAHRGNINQDGSVCAVLSGCEGLRRSGAFRLPLSPFLDKHGRVLATHPLLGKEDLRDIVSALINRLSAQTTMTGEGDVDKLGCCRLIAGITSVLPLSEIEKRFDKTTRRAWRALLEERSDGGMLRRALDMSSRDFTEELARRAAI